ncbi:ABC transporter ATP-binding protein [Massilia sp. CF038]|uniref:ABC transporter ATP-binding protein n=1 Tax=Massilia sp. CF038 TaxID=1881045 RepID=UPI000923D97B|nr:sn-glycerol-3-phosphate ABC transporter ATP-binding protein UgpC [Massilia sp. CF038]SHH17027.1 multiple sugar transport system ATP-binding protein [Massilia sp. CF038]
MASLHLSNVTKHYDDKQPVIHGVDLEIGDGEFVVFVGPSGCGKSTLLRMIAGLEQISGGQLHIGGKLANDTPPAQRGLAMVFQSYALYPHMTVFDNMAFALKLAGQKGAQLNEAVQRAAAILQIGHLLDRKPKELSGGQRQRVAIGRAIVRKPGVFLFDEPLSNLDASLRVQMRVELSRLHQDLKSTMIYVTHDQVEAMTLGQRIVVMNGGRIEQAGTPHQLYNHPANLFVAGFLGAPKMNFIKATVAQVVGSRIVVRLPDGSLFAPEVEAGDARVEDQVTLGVRPEHMGPGDTITLTVAHAEYLGDQTVVYGSMSGDASLIAVKLAPDRAPPSAGSTLGVQLLPHRSHLFNAQGAAFLHPVTNKH